ncbi:MAG: 50S ribosomal protein L29 [Deltaproteobacteria bacterium]|nr:MAG: 50S ribosomal protein L29 [Deltaproteobacteria bacterium]
MSENNISAENLRGLSEDELQKYLDDYRQELFNLRFQHHTGQLENFRRIQLVKRNIARILTVQNERN